MFNSFPHIAEDDITMEFSADNTTHFCDTTLCNLSSYGELIFFLSYVKEVSYQTVSQFKIETERLGHKCQIDCNAEGTFEEVEYIIQQCNVFIPILTKSYFSQESCLMEISWAMQHQKKIQPLHLPSDKDNIGHMNNVAPQYFSWVFKRNILPILDTDLRILRRTIPIILNDAVRAESSPRLPDGYDAEKIVKQVIYPPTETVCIEGHHLKPKHLELIANQKSKQPPETYHKSFPTLRYAFSTVVLVGLWDPEENKIIRAGSGFIVDNKRGLIMTVAHTLMEIDNKKCFGKANYGNLYRKVVIGLIPEDGGNATEAVIRYFAKIITKDKSIDKNKICQVDACVLQITTKMDSDVDGDRCGEVAECPIMHGKMKNENLNKLNIDGEIVDPDTDVAIIGFNQKWEGFINSSGKVNLIVDYVYGKVSIPNFKYTLDFEEKNKYQPKAETIVICAATTGHSGGPCINREGNVIGMMCRKNDKNEQRCYLVPSCELIALLKKAKKRQ